MGIPQQCAAFLSRWPNILVRALHLHRLALFLPIFYRCWRSLFNSIYPIHPTRNKPTPRMPTTCSTTTTHSRSIWETRLLTVAVAKTASRPGSRGRFMAPRALPTVSTPALPTLFVSSSY